MSVCRFGVLVVRVNIRIPGARQNKFMGSDICLRAKGRLTFVVQAILVDRLPALAVVSTLNFLTRTALTSYTIFRLCNQSQDIFMLVAATT